MPKASEQFRQSDVTVWGTAALVCGAIAVLSANVSAILPAGLLSGLHSSRIDGANLSQLRVQLVELQTESARMRRENEVLMTRFSMQEQASNAVVQRIGSLEVSIPKLIEALPLDAQIDRSSLTASIKEGEALTYDTEGGSVKIRQQPLASPAVVEPQAMPDQLQTAAVLPDETRFGVAIGPKIAFEEAQSAWQDISMKLGPLLFGLGPLLAEDGGTDQKRIIVGPIDQLSEASALCARLERISIPCMPMPFTGTPL